MNPADREDFFDPGSEFNVCGGGELTGTASLGIEPMFLEVFREERGRIWGFLMRGTAAEDAAEDLLQETFVRVWDRRQALQADLGTMDREAMRKYLWRVARNLMVDEIRLRQRQRRIIREDTSDEKVQVEAAADSRPGVAEEMEWQEALQVVRETVGRIKNHQGRRCLELWLEGLSPEEIAERLSLGSGRVRGLLQRTRSEVILRATHRLRPTAAGRQEKRAGK